MLSLSTPAPQEVPTLFHSQFGQDRFIYERFFQGINRGFFVEVGAHDGDTFSNTYFFEKQLGWNGILVEPLPWHQAPLWHNRSAKVVMGVCSATQEPVRRFLAAYGRGEMRSCLLDTDQRSIDAINRHQEGGAGMVRVIDVPNYRLSDLLGDQEVIDYLSIDVEGAELDVLHGIDFSQHHINVLSFEQHYEECIDTKMLLEHSGFEFVTTLGHDQIWANKQLRREGANG